MVFRGIQVQYEEPAMSRYILVPATGADTDAPVFATALDNRRLLPAHLEFLHVRADVQETLTAMASADMGGGMGYGQLPESLEREVASRQKKAELAFRDFCEQEKLLVSADPTASLPVCRMADGDRRRTQRGSPCMGVRRTFGGRTRPRRGTRRHGPARSSAHGEPGDRH